MDKKTIMIAAVVLIILIAIGSFIYISINSHNTKIEVLSNSTLKNGDYVTIKLTDEYRHVYPDEVIDVKILDDTGWPHKYQVTTDTDGEASFELQTLENGNYTLHCNFNGTMFNKASRSVTQLEINDGLN